MSKSLNNIELRRLSAKPAEFRVERVIREDGGEDTYISGYAVVFEQYSRPIWDEWVEIISRNAFANCDMSDVVMVIDHARDVSSVLARSRNGEGTLEITIDEVGVAFRFRVPDTTAGHDMVSLIQRGDISECSFAFWVSEDRWLYDVAFGDKTYDVRRIESIAKLADLSIVVSGQYGQTSVSVEERALVNEARNAGKSPKSTACNGMSAELAENILRTL
jgi:HK97 family phage prohead protease